MVASKASTWTTHDMGRWRVFHADGQDSTPTTQCMGRACALLLIAPAAQPAGKTGRSQANSKQIPGSGIGLSTSLSHAHNCDGWV
jgi:hypothetical protein